MINYVINDVIVVISNNLHNSYTFVSN